MDSPALPNLTPTASAQTATSAAATTPDEAPALDFAAMLALGLTAAAPDPALEPGLPATDTEDPVIAAATDPVPPDLGALLLPDRLTAIQQLATQTQLLPAHPPPAAGGDGRMAAPIVAAEPAAKSAGAGEWLPPAPADTAGTTRPAFTDMLPAVTPGSNAGIPTATMTGLPAQPSAIAQPAAPAIHRVEVPVPLSQPGWSEAFSSRVVWMAGQHQQSAELHVNPPELGPIDIVLSFDRDQAHVHFSSAHLPVREAIETALPALRDALGQAGIQLGETSVSAEDFQRPGESPQRGSARHPGNEDGHAVPPGRSAAAHIGLVDTFA